MTPHVDPEIYTMLGVKPEEVEGISLEELLGRAVEQGRTATIVISRSQRFTGQVRVRL